MTSYEGPLYIPWRLLDVGNVPAPPNPEMGAGRVFRVSAEPETEHEQASDATEHEPSDTTEHEQPSDAQSTPNWDPQNSDQQNPAIQLSSTEARLTALICQNYRISRQAIMQNLDLQYQPPGYWPLLPSPYGFVPPTIISPKALIHRLRWENSRPQLDNNYGRQHHIYKIARAMTTRAFRTSPTPLSPKMIIAALLNDIDIAFFNGALRGRVVVSDNATNHFDNVPPGARSTRSRIEVPTEMRQRGIELFRVVLKGTLVYLCHILAGDYGGWSTVQSHPGRHTVPNYIKYNAFGCVQLVLDHAGIAIDMSSGGRFPPPDPSQPPMGSRGRPPQYGPPPPRGYPPRGYPPGRYYY